jgi:hypothetical protein
MKLFLLTDNLSDGGPIWINILWPTVKVYSECFDVTLLEVPPNDAVRRPRGLAKLDTWRRMRRQGRSWDAQIRRDLDPSGPNVLLVWAASTNTVAWSRALEPVWPLFSHKVLQVLDTMQPEHVSKDDLAKFDLVTCFCRDLGDAYAAKTNQPTLFLPEHLDTLSFHCFGGFRPLDLLLVGRRDDRHHRPLYAHFNAPQRDRIFIDLVTRGQTAMTRQQEFRLLMSAHAKAAAAFCYETGDVPRFRGRSPLLSRWVHAWTSGCTVFGTRPRGGGTEELMDWPEATIELPADAKDAIELVEATLSDGKGMALRRYRNVLEAVRRHDTRYRVAQILGHLDLPLSAPLVTGLEQLDELAEQVALKGDAGLKPLLRA